MRRRCAVRCNLWLVVLVAVNSHVPYFVRMSSAAISFLSSREINLYFHKSLTVKNVCMRLMRRCQRSVAWRRLEETFFKHSVFGLSACFNFFIASETKTSYNSSLDDYLVFVGVKLERSYIRLYREHFEYWKLNRPPDFQLLQLNCWIRSHSSLFNAFVLGIVYLVLCYAS